MKRKRRKEWKKKIGKKTLKSIMIQDHEVRCSVVCVPFHEAQSKLTQLFRRLISMGQTGADPGQSKRGIRTIHVAVTSPNGTISHHSKLG